jgi:hypothetical protein
MFNMLVMEPGSLIMERKMLLGIKQRAQGLARDARLEPDARRPTDGSGAARRRTTWLAACSWRLLPRA